MSIILDLAVVAVVVICIILAAKKGFVRTLIDLIGFVAAIAVAFTLSSPISSFLYEKTIEPPVSKAVYSAVDKSLGETTESAKEAINKLFDSLPAGVSKLADKTGYSADALAEKMQSATDSEEISNQICANVIEPAISTIVKYIVAILLFVITLILMKFVSKFINSLFKGALLGTANLVLGGALGACKGIIFVAIGCMAISLIAGLISNNSLSDAIDNTRIFKTILNLIPFGI